MLFISSTVLLIGLLSMLSLEASADEFSDGTADYVVLDWEEERTLNDTMMEESIEYNYNLKLEIFAIQGDDAQCDYKVLRVYYAPTGFGGFPHRFVLGHVLKASCSVSLSTLTSVVRYCIDLNAVEVEYKLEGNKCRKALYLPLSIRYEDSQCPEYPNIPESSELEPDELSLELSHSYSDTDFVWDGRFSFVVKSKRDKNYKCEKNWLRVDYTTDDDETREFKEFKIFRCSCDVDLLSLHRFVKKIGPDTLVFKLKDTTCLRTKAKYDSMAKRVDVVEQVTVNCDEFFKRFNRPLTVH